MRPEELDKKYLEEYEEAKARWLEKPDHQLAMKAPATYFEEATKFQEETELRWISEGTHAYEKVLDYYQKHNRALIALVLDLELQIAELKERLSEIAHQG